jgi:glycogen synthase
VTDGRSFVLDCNATVKSLKVALLPSAYAPAVGGVEQLTKCLAAELVEQGHEVEIWVNLHPSELPAAEMIDGIPVRRFRMVLPAGNPRSVLAFPGGSGRVTRQMGAAMRRFTPDVLHVQCFSVNGVYAAALARMFRMPLVVSLQGETVMDDNDIYERSVSLRYGLRFGLRTARAVTACSQFTLDDAVARFGLPAGAGMVIPNGVEVDDTAEPAPIELPFSRFVLAMGRMVEKKGFDLLIDAFAQLADAHPEVGLLIGGDGAARQPLLAQVKAAGLEQRVVLPGRFSRGAVRWATSHASVFVLPSRVEPFGIVVLEAMAAGVPVVVSSRGGAGEIVRDGIDGLVADPFDREALATAIERVLDDAAARERFVASARDRVREFDWPLITRRYLDVYDSVTAEGR